MKKILIALSIVSSLIVAKTAYADGLPAGDYDGIVQVTGSPADAATGNSDGTPNVTLYLPHMSAFGGKSGSLAILGLDVNKEECFKDAALTGGPAPFNVSANGCKWDGQKLTGNFTILGLGKTGTFTIAKK